MSVNTAGTLGLVASIVLIILLYVKVLPRKMEGRETDGIGKAGRSREADGIGKAGRSRKNV